MAMWPIPAPDHPWALCTCNLAKLYYTLENQIQKTQTVPLDQFSTTFFSQIGVTPASPVADVVSKLQDAGDTMLAAVIYHSDHLELSEQFDARHRIRKERQEPDLELRGFSIRRARPDRSKRRRVMPDGEYPASKPHGWRRVRPRKRRSGS